MEIKNIIYNEDCIMGVKKMDDESIDLVVTSPPYFNLRDYGVSGQIGAEDTVDDYIHKLIILFNEIKRVLKKSGSCWVNIGDVYKDNTLMCVPDKFKIEMVKSGWICRNEVIWHKPNSMPCSAKNRFNNDFEKFYFFVKSNDYYFETQYEPFKSALSVNLHNNKIGKYGNSEIERSVRQGMSCERGTKTVQIRKNLPSQDDFVSFIRSVTDVDTIVKKTGINKSKVEHWFRKDCSGFSYPSIEDWYKVLEVVNDGSEIFYSINKKMLDISIETDDILKNSDKGRLKRAVWSINTKPFVGEHFAPYPEELIETPIIACCPVGGLVLDPFMGSGTTAVVSIKNNRNYVGFELNSSYCKIANDRANATKVEKNSELF